MRIFLRSASIFGYFFFGYLWFHSCYDIITRNVFFEIFTFEQTITNEITYKINSKDSTIYHINYKLQVNETSFKGETKVSKLVFDERFGTNPQNITIEYNKSIPEINNIINWQKDDYYIYILL